MSHPYHVLLVGPGGYGLRHLQSLPRLGPAVSLSVLGRSVAGLNRAKELMQRESPSWKVDYINDIKAIKRPVDLAIVATCSNVRFPVASALLEKVGVKRLILEKILFNDLLQYGAFLGLVNRVGAKVWVNSKKRSLPAYETLKCWFQGEAIEQVRFSGVNFGLASNAIHIIDLAEYLTDSRVKTLSGGCLHDKIFEAKRRGFWEFRGNLEGTLQNGGRLIISDRDDCEKNKVLEVQGERTSFRYNELQGCAWRNGRAVKWKPEVQSELTRNNWDILTADRCRLTDLHNSVRQHKILLGRLLGHLQRLRHIGLDSTKCPIT